MTATKSWATTTNDRRRRPMITLTLSEPHLVLLATLSERLGLPRGQVVEQALTALFTSLVGTAPAESSRKRAARIQRVLKLAKADP